MAIPELSERAAGEVERLLARWENQALQAAVTGRPVPSAAGVLRQVERLVTVAVTAAVVEVEDDPEEIAATVAVTMGYVSDAVAVYLADMERIRREVRRADPPGDDDDETGLVELAATVGVGVAVRALVRRVRARDVLGRRLRVNTAEIVKAAGRRPPSRVSGYSRTALRTELVKGRNMVAQRVAVRDGLVLWVRDGLRGPTDVECERVDRRFASPGWARRNLLAHPNCVAPGQVVSGPGDVLAAWSRPFQGELVHIVTASGAQLSVTPHHPVLTTGGWMPAHLVDERTDLVRYVGGERARVGVPHDDQRPALIEQVADALIEAGSVAAVQVPASPEQFHGDGTVDGDVDVVWTDRFLTYQLPEWLEDPPQALLVAVERAGAFLPEGASGQVGVGADHASDGVVGGGGDLLPALRADALHVEALRFAAGSCDAEVAKSMPDGAARDVVVGGDHVGRFPGLVSADDFVVDRVVGTRVETGELRVHDLTTSVGWFGCNGIIVANCTREMTPMVLPAGARVSLR